MSATNLQFPREKDAHQIKEGGKELLSTSAIL